eukprot:1160105-Pelagomonas_calceolata.AAC.8
MLQAAETPPASVVCLWTCGASPTTGSGEGPQSHAAAADYSAAAAAAVVVVVVGADVDGAGEGAHDGLPSACRGRCKHASEGGGWGC